jgi:hypothetical protein
VTGRDDGDGDGLAVGAAGDGGPGVRLRPRRERADQMWALRPAGSGYHRLPYAAAPHGRWRLDRPTDPLADPPTDQLTDSPTDPLTDPPTERNNEE